MSKYSVSEKELKQMMPPQLIVLNTNTPPKSPEKTKQNQIAVETYMIG